MRAALIPTAKRAEHARASTHTLTTLRSVLSLLLNFSDRHQRRDGVLSHTKSKVTLWITLRITCERNVRFLPYRRRQSPNLSALIPIYLYFSIGYVGIFELDEKESMHLTTNSFLACACA
jgi:hypothetical protein